jgi:hypothetical protein
MVRSGKCPQLFLTGGGHDFNHGYADVEVCHPSNMRPGSVGPSCCHPLLRRWHLGLSRRLILGARRTASPPFEVTANGPATRCRTALRYPLKV